MLNHPRVEVPLHSSADGSVFVADSPVLLEHLVAEFERGLPAEEIVARHRELTLSDVFLVLAYYINHRKQVESYLAERHAPRTRPKPAA